MERLMALIIYSNDIQSLVLDIVDLRVPMEHGRVTFLGREPPALFLSLNRSLILTGFDIKKTGAVKSPSFLTGCTLKSLPIPQNQF
jgi:hypothetical protein